MEQQKLEIIWKHIGNDRKLLIDGKRFIVGSFEYGMLPLESMPKAELQRLYSVCSRRANVERNKSLAKPIIGKYGLKNHFQSTDQWWGSFEDLVTFASFALNPPVLKLFKNELEKALSL